MGLGGGHRGGGGRIGGGHRSGFRSSHHHHHHHYHHFRHGRGGFFFGGSSIFAFVVAMIMGLIVIGFGIATLAISAQYNDYVPVEAVVESREERYDYSPGASSVIYYQYTLEYEYDNEEYIVFWDDDYKEEIGAIYTIYIDSNNPRDFEFDNPLENSTAPRVVGGILIAVGGIVFIAGCTSIARGRKKSDSEE